MNLNNQIQELKDRSRAAETSVTAVLDADAYVVQLGMVQPRRVHVQFVLARVVVRLISQQ